MDRSIPARSTIIPSAAVPGPVAGPRRWRGVLAATVVAASIGLVAAACGSNESATDTTTTTADRANKGVIESDETPTPGGKLVYGLYSETNGWNPATNQWSPAGLQVTAAIFDTITAYDENSSIKPNLAESFESNPEFKEWTFKLRPGITLHNGKPVTADVVVRNQKYLSTSAITGPAFKYSGVVDISALDELTFKVTLSKPYANYPIAFATQLGVVADPDWLESNDSLHPIGTGPFEFDSWTIGNSVKVKRNAHYWRTDAAGTPLPYLDSKEIKVLVDDGARAMALRNGDIDVLQTYSGEQLQEFRDSASDLQVITNSKSESRDSMVQLNTMAAPFTDLNARLALAYATDKDAFAQVVHGGFHEVANGPFAPSSPWFSPSGYPQYDPVKAQQLVDQVKAANNGEFAFTIVGPDDAETRFGAQVLEEQWAKVGITATIELLPAQSNIIKVISGDYQAAMWGQFETPDPYADGVWWSPDLAVPPPELTLNFARNKDPEIGAALATGGASSDPAVQLQQMAIVQQRLGADAPYIWLVHLRISRVANDRVVNLTRWTLPDGTRGLDMNQGAHQLFQVWMKP
jgi:ABC-type transport system substrate-binding protein